MIVPSRKKWMLEDKLLIVRFKRGSRGALRRIYEKYRTYLLRLATALLCDPSAAEDIVHDVFLRFAQSQHEIRLQGSLKSYLRTCVLNRARNKLKSQQARAAVGLDDIAEVPGEFNDPGHWVTLKEESIRLSNALARIPWEQREVVVLHLHTDMTFREIAALQKVAIKTAQSRYRYALDKLRSLLNHETEK